MQLKLTLGEIAFAVATVDSYERAVGLIRTQFDVPRMEDALLFIQASAQSLHARDLAVALTPAVQLTPPVIEIGKVFAKSEWMVRCSKVMPDETVPTLLVHCSSAGVLAHEVVTGHVHRVAPARDIGALLAQIDRFFGLSHVDSSVPKQKLPRQVFDALVKESEPHAIEATLYGSGSMMSHSLRSALARDIATPLWRGEVSWAHHPSGKEPEIGVGFHVYAGERNWLFEITSLDTVIVSEATRQHLADATMRVIERVPLDERRFV
ncbi:MAG TPA: hypothetical protein VGD80_24420 [Kofleriaceae bacterium]